MHAVVQDRYGHPEQVLRLAEVPRPEPGPGEVLVRVRATSVNTPDWIAVTGTPYLLRAGKRPAGAIRGTDIAGVVAALGEGVTGLSPGDAVFGTASVRVFPTTGAFAEYTAVDAANLIPKPAAVSFEDAAAAVMSGMTAWSAMTESYPAGPGRRVLINGASGGVGTFAVQIAKHRGAHVTGVCGPTNLDLVRDLGADAVIDYRRTDFTAAGERYDAILDNVLNHPPRRSFRALAPGGVFMPNSVGNSGGLIGGLARVGGAVLRGKLGRAQVRMVRGEYTRERLTAIADLLASGAIRSVVDRVYALDQTPKAVAHMFEHHARGNIVIAVPD